MNSTIIEWIALDADARLPGPDDAVVFVSRNQYRGLIFHVGFRGQGNRFGDHWRDSSAADWDGSADYVSDVVAWAPVPDVSNVTPK